jgi:hypothetical protein
MTGTITLHAPNGRKLAEARYSRGFTGILRGWKALYKNYSTYYYQVSPDVQTLIEDFKKIA